MPNQNAFDSTAQNNSDGGQIGMGLTFSRLFKWLGADITVTGNGQAVVTFPTGTATLLSTQLNELGSLFSNAPSGTTADRILIERSDQSFNKYYLTLDQLFSSNLLQDTAYNPVVTNGANVAASSASSNWRVFRIGTLVFVMGRFTMSVSVANTLSTISFSLPYDTVLAQAYDLMGYAGQQAQTEAGGAVFGDTANTRAIFTYFPSATTSRSYQILFAYRIG